MIIENQASRIKSSVSRTSSGTVFDIKRFAVHDGPGIRTTVFLKSCMLQCRWCQNPEGISPKIELRYLNQKCICCGRCVDSCKEHALRVHPVMTNQISRKSQFQSVTEKNEALCKQPVERADAVTVSPQPDIPRAFIEIDRERCTYCGRCVDNCPTGAMVFSGKKMYSREVIEEVLRDHLFYETSGGGMTLSGGEPLAQADFSLAILELARQHGIHRVIQTCLAVDWEIIVPFLNLVDLFLVDLKIFNSEMHRQWTGQGNELIMENLLRLVKHDIPCIIRIPLIPGATANEQNLRSLARFVHQNARQVHIELLNFNPLSRSKYRQLGKEYEFESVNAPFTKDKIELFQEWIRSEHVCMLE